MRKGGGGKTPFYHFGGVFSLKTRAFYIVFFRGGGGKKGGGGGPRGLTINPLGGRPPPFFGELRRFSRAGVGGAQFF